MVATRIVVTVALLALLWYAWSHEWGAPVLTVINIAIALTFTLAVRDWWRGR